MEERAFIERMLARTTAMALEHYPRRAAIHVSSKANPNDLLTEVDLAIQDAIVEGIRRQFPNDAVAAEERDFSRLPADPGARCWVIDPIDGTQNFVRGLFPAFGISIALAVGGQPVAGGVAIPGTGDVFLAERGAGATRNGRAARVSDVRSVSMARVEIDFAGPLERRETVNRSAEIVCAAGQVRCNSATAAALCTIASNDMDGFFHVGLFPWDYAAGMLIVQEAGGKVTRLDGSPVALFDGGLGMAATNGHIHDEFLRLIPRA